MNVLKLPLTVLVLSLSVATPAQEDEHGTEEEESSVVEMTADERMAAGIDTASVSRHGISGQVKMPAEVVANAYKSSRVTTRAGHSSACAAR